MKFLSEKGKCSIPRYKKTYLIQKTQALWKSDFLTSGIANSDLRFSTLPASQLQHWLKNDNAFNLCIFE